MMCRRYSAQQALEMGLVNAAVPHDRLDDEVDTWCRPCSQNGRRRCYRREQYCLTGTSVDAVGSSINHLLGMA